MSGRRNEPIEIVDSLSDEEQPEEIPSGLFSIMASSCRSHRPQRTDTKSGGSAWDAIELSSESSGNDEADSDEDATECDPTNEAAKKPPSLDQRKGPQQIRCQETFADGLYDPSRQDQFGEGGDDEGDNDHHPEPVAAFNSQQFQRNISAPTSKSLPLSSHLDFDDCEGDKKVAAKKTAPPTPACNDYIYVPTDPSSAAASNGGSGRPDAPCRKRQWNDKQGLGSPSRRFDEVNFEDGGISSEAESDIGAEHCDDGGDVDLMSISMRLMIPSKSGNGEYQWKILKASDCCPLCSYAIANAEKLVGHVRKFHSDEFRFEHIACTKDKDGMNMINVVAKARHVLRNQGTEFKAERQYFKSKSRIPIEDGHHDRDSDDESTDSWYHEYRDANLNDYIDVEPNERELMKMWNRFLGCSPVTLADREIPSKFDDFLTKHGRKLQRFEWELYQMIITFWEHRLLSSEHVERLMHKFHQLR